MHKPPSRTSEAYVRLRERITTGQLAPGAVVSEASLAKELGLSRTPIGEALRRLSQDGLVEQVPRYGTIVREITPAELEELFEIREALEGMAASKAADRITPTALEELGGLCGTIENELHRAETSGETRLEGEALRRFLSADLAFHMLIIASAGNSRLTELIDNTRSISSMFNARRGEHSVERIRNAAEAHRAILDALLRRDAMAAQAEVVAHIRTSCKQSLQAPTRRPPVSLGTLNLPDSVRQDLAS
ncbi:GntR family transcriptional regulator [Botrimarina sp.]|uniref:GntR family transcriptional regulator n=1 Tax=Botrimarina sp. TaxID=2795802 RepID=UPI0032EFA2D3